MEPIQPGPSRTTRHAERKQPSTDDSSRSTSLETALLRNLAIEGLVEQAAHGELPRETLKRLLSRRSVALTSSDFAQSQQAAVRTRAPFRDIGVGAVGRVFEHPGTAFVYKLNIHEGGSSKLWNNFAM